jgi:hypothetical protein
MDQYRIIPEKNGYTVTCDPELKNDLYLALSNMAHLLNMTMVEAKIRAAKEIMDKNG